jgi:Ser/Thr protein kinase RdoA (MazF antagonist)
VEVRSSWFDESEARELLSNKYGLHVAQLQTLTSNFERVVYRAGLAGGESIVLRIYSATNDVRAPYAQASALQFFERHTYDAPRLLLSKKGSAVFEGGRLKALALSYIEGQCTGFDPQSLRLLAESLARLHSLSLSSMDQVLPSTFQVDEQSRIAIDKLNEVSGIVENPLRAIWNGFHASLCSCRKLASLPRTLIHTDPYPENAIRTPGGRVVYIDWDDAGIGTALIDFAHLVGNCEGDQEYHTNLRPDIDRVRALTEAYNRIRPLRADEIDALPMALRFTPAVYGAWHLATAIKSAGASKKWQWWWTRYEAADEVAAMIRKFI